MAKVGRNDPCPCGSGKKYKQCCVDKPAEQAPKAMRLGLPILLGLAAIGFAGLIWSSKGVVPGLIVGAGGLMIVGLVLLLRDPPSSTGGGDPGAINFGG